MVSCCMVQKILNAHLNVKEFMNYGFKKLKNTTSDQTAVTEANLDRQL